MPARLFDIDFEIGYQNRLYGQLVLRDMTAPTLPRLLIVDDNRAFADNLAEILDDAGYPVRTAGTCSEGLVTAEAGFDVALVDLELPDGKGTWLTGQLRARNPAGEVVLLTAFASVESAQAAIRTGACAYLLKPCAVPEVLLAVRQAAQRVQLHAEKEELTRRARTAEKLAAIGTLSAGLSHEIRNPLNAAGLQLTVLERRIGKLDPEVLASLREPLELVRNEVKRLNQVLNDFLQFARPRELRRSPVDLAELVRWLAAFLAPDADRHRITIEAVCEPVPSVAADDQHLRQALINLALNAVQAAGEHGRVRLTVQTEAGEVVIRVEDSGPGLPAEAEARVFEPFFTGQETGSGLGLPIAHSIVTQLGGSLTVDGSPLGGARFTARFPAIGRP